MYDPSWSVYSFCPGIIIHVLAYGTAKAACLVLRGKAAFTARAPTQPEKRVPKNLEPMHSVGYPSGFPSSLPG